MESRASFQPRRLRNGKLARRRPAPEPVRTFGGTHPTSTSLRSLESFTVLPTEILLLIADRFKLDDPVSLESLKNVALASRRMHKIVTDSCRLRKAFDTNLAFEQRMLTNWSFSTLKDATPYSVYAESCRLLIHHVIGPAISESTPEEIGIPLQGWENLVSVALLVRVKIIGFDSLHSPSQRYLNQQRVPAGQLTNVELLCMAYGALLFQKIFLNRVRGQDRELYLAIAKRRILLLEALHLSFIRFGPLSCLRLCFGWVPPRLGTFITPLKMFGYLNWLLMQDRESPPAPIETFLLNLQLNIFYDLEDYLELWRDELSIDKPKPFEKVGVAKEGAETLCSLLGVWNDLEHDDLPWIWQEE